MIGEVEESSMELTTDTSVMVSDHYEFAMAA